VCFRKQRESNLNIIDFIRIHGVGLDMFIANISLGVVFLIVGIYIISALLEFIPSKFNINISILDPLIENIFNRKHGEKTFQKLIGKIYSFFIEIILWLIPIFCIIAAAIIAGKLAGNIFGILIGIILGLIAGLLVDILLCGFIVIFLNMRSSVNKLKENK